MLYDGISLTTTGDVLKNGTSIIPTAVNYYDLVGGTFAKPGNAEVLMRFVANRVFTIPAGFAGSVAKSSVAATAAVTYVINRTRGGTTVAIGKITFAAAGTSGTVADGTGETGVHALQVGDIVTVVAPATADTTQDGLSWTFTGTAA